jgi:sugar phosphate isomerase/epimerase
VERSTTERFPAEPRSTPLKLGLVTEVLAESPLAEVMRWLREAAPAISGLEIIAGGYGPRSHCDRDGLLAESTARSAWLDELRGHGFEVAALNAWGNPLHPEPSVSAAQDRDLRETIRLAAALDVNRVVALAGCPGAGPDDRTTPHFAAGAWLPDLEGVSEWQWEAEILPYWSELSDFARREYPELLICLELHPGTCVHNVEEFERVSAVGGNIAANLDPSHLFWQGMDAFAVIDHLGQRIAHAHAKDMVFNEERRALNGVLDRRWPHPPDEMPWRFAAVGDGRPGAWWRRLAEALEAFTLVETLAIEHEDQLKPALEGIPQAAALLAEGRVVSVESA